MTWAISRPAMSTLGSSMRRSVSARGFPSFFRTAPSLRQPAWSSSDSASFGSYGSPLSLLSPDHGVLGRTGVFASTASP